MKLRAFSFLEVLVSIVISGIVMSTGYSVYVFSHQRFFKFSSSKTEIRNYFELANVLNREFETAKKVVKKGDQELEIHLADKKINYSFESDNLLRTFNNRTDTFKLTFTDIEIRTLENVQQEKLINYMKISSDDVSKKYNLSFYKNYGAIFSIEE